MAARFSKPKPVRRGRPPGHFTQHHRIEKLRKALEGSPGGLPLTAIAHHLGVTVRSVRRYVDGLKSALDLEAVPTAPGGAKLWRIKPAERSRSVWLRRTQAYGLLAARPIFDVMRGTALFDELDLALSNILQLAQRPTRAGTTGEIPHDQRLEERLVYVPHPSRSYLQRREELDDVFQAVAELRPLSLRYDDERATVHPYALLIHRGGIQYIGLDCARDELRIFALDRTLDTKPDESRRFPLPDDFDLRQWIHGAFGLAPPGPRSRVLIEFDARAAAEVRSSRLHPTQKIAVAPDGRVRLSMSLPLTTELKRWVLAFGDLARVIEPAELAEDVASTLAAAASRYAHARAT
jgi:predicted DNA-binding transcriptional regulator YafY